MTKDDQLAVIHGGFNGELPHINPEDETIYIYNLTLEEARAHFRKTNVYKDFLETVPKDTAEV